MGDQVSDPGTTGQCNSQWEASNGPVKSDKVGDQVNNPGTTVQCNSQWEASNGHIKSDTRKDRGNGPLSAKNIQHPPPEGSIPQARTCQTSTRTPYNHDNTPFG